MLILNGMELLAMSLKDYMVNNYSKFYGDKEPSSLFDRIMRFETKDIKVAKRMFRFAAKRGLGVAAIESHRNFHVMIPMMGEEIAIEFAGKFGEPAHYVVSKY